jgi:hypothetical protein
MTLSRNHWNNLTRQYVQLASLQVRADFVGTPQHALLQRFDVLLPVAQLQLVRFRCVELQPHAVQQRFEFLLGIAYSQFVKSPGVALPPHALQQHFDVLQPVANSQLVM